MNRNRHLWLWLVVLLWYGAGSAAAIAPATGGSLRGFFRDHSGQPVPGALVALYSAEDNLLIDQTYSVDDGSFALRPVLNPGHYYVVATKNLTARRVDFNRPADATEPQLIWIWYDTPRNWLAEAKELWNYLSLFVGAFLGFLGGWATKKIDQRKLFSAQIDQLKEPRSQVLNLGLELRALINERRTIPGSKQTRCDELLSEYNRKLEELDDPLSDLEARKIDLPLIHEFCKQQGCVQYYELGHAIRSIRSFCKKRFDDLIVSASWEEEFKCFEILRNNHLIPQ